jgi:hypothetical protein
MLRTLLATATLTAVAAMAPSAWATPITVHAFPEGSRLSDTTISNYFDLSRVALPSGAVLRSASFAFAFADDDADSYTETSTKTSEATSAYVLSSTVVNANGDTVSHYTREHGLYFDDRRDYQQESARVNIGGFELSGATSATQTTTYRTDHFLNAVEIRPAPGVIDWYDTDLVTYRTILTTDWSGSFSVAGTITNPDTLVGLLSRASLPFSLAVSGDLRVTAATLTLNIAEPGDEPLPEPSSALLALAGGAALMLRRRVKVDPKNAA